MYDELNRGATPGGSFFFDYSAWIFYLFRSNQSKPRERNTVMANDKRQQCIDECVACAQVCQAMAA
ncbi:MAG: hypothetical protein CME33_26655 [Gimesia sp.]|nr:hypothetical protein [Gimesia sp.]